MIMIRDDLKEIILRVIERTEHTGDTDDGAPAAGCLFKDAPDPCDVTTFYAVGEEG